MKDIINESDRMTDRTAPVRFFRGLEVEATNHFLKQIMIAPNMYDYEEVNEVLNEQNVNHILLGYMCDPAGNNLDMDTAKAFDLVDKLLADGRLVTVEIRPDQLTDELVARCPEPNGPYGKQFVILLGSYFPNMPKIAPYTTLKLFSDFADPLVPGVYCQKAESFVGNSVMTPWQAYADDFKVR